LQFLYIFEQHKTTCTKLKVCFQHFKDIFQNAVHFFPMIILLFWCGVYPGSIWEWKFLNYRETVQRLFPIEERNFKASSQNICNYCVLLYTESAGDAVQVFSSEWCPACYVCWRNDTSFVKMVWEIHVSKTLICVSFWIDIFLNFS